MTTNQLTTVEAGTAPVSSEPAGGRRLVPFARAFLAGAAATLLVAATGVAVFETRYDGLVLPGVHVGDVDLSGLDGAAATARLRERYASLSEGRLLVTGSLGTTELAYRSLGRGIDAPGLVRDALALGRSGDPVARVAAHVRLLLHGVSLAPRVVYDEAALSRGIAATTARLEERAVDARVVLVGNSFRSIPGIAGRRADPERSLAVARAALAALDGPAELEIPLTPVRVPPAVTDEEAAAAAAAATRISQPLILRLGDETWKLGWKSLTSWIRFTTVDGAYLPVLDREAVARSLGVVGRKIKLEATDASFRIGARGKVVGVGRSAPGRTLDVTASTLIVESALLARTTPGAGMPDVVPAVTSIAPSLTTGDARLVAPRMRRISTWTTYYPISELNGFGTNIEIPTRLLDGQVVAAGATFDFWKAIGDPSAEGGYKPGAAIINGRSEPTGALAGGICSCSSTLFNAALRAGFQMRDRKNHYYYIDRYPLGLDATVFIGSGGWRQTMSWTNDTAYPVLIRGSIRHVGARGYVTFDLWSVPSGRTVSFSAPVVKNVVRAATRYERTALLARGVSRQLEFPHDGKDVWVTRTVRDAAGVVIRTDTWYSHYARIDGIVQVGTAGGGTTPAPDPSPAPTPTPAPTGLP